MSVCLSWQRKEEPVTEVIHIPANQGARASGSLLSSVQLPKAVAQGYTASEEQCPASAEGSPAPRETQLIQPHWLVAMALSRSRKEKVWKPEELVHTCLEPCTQGSDP